MPTKRENTAAGNWAPIAQDGISFNFFVDIS